MSALIRCLCSDYRKTKRLPIRMAHLVIPFGIAGVFLLYYWKAPWSELAKIEGYFQVLGIGFPVLIGLFSALTAEQEASAASYQILLSAPNRLPMFYSKLLLLITMGAFAISVASITFGLGNIFLLRKTSVSMSFYLMAAGILILGSILLYTFHFVLALRYNKGVTIIIGIIESLIAALFLTSMGDSIWCYVLCAFAPRLITQLLRHSYDRKCTIAIVLCVIMMLCGAAAYGIWASQWEGQHTSD